LPKLITEKALQAKAKIIRKHIIEMTGAAGSGHPGGSLSIADIIAVLYFSHMKIKPEDPSWPDRDRFVLSKGHGCPALYAALAETGYFPVKKLLTLRKLGSMLQGHPDMRRTPGVEMSSGSLGLGVSAAVGMALAAKIDKKTYNVYSIIGDGESQEGIVWESALFASHYNLDNLVVFLDNNGLQIDGSCQDIISLEPIDDKWKAFGWHTIKIDGHDIGQITESLEKANKVQGKPVIIIAKTVKGKGVSFMENQVDWHGRAPSKEEVEKALKELGD
jgi:transketolase